MLQKQLNYVAEMFYSYLDITKQTRRKEGIPTGHPSPADVEVQGHSSTPWRGATKGGSKRGPGSDCKSMSADSPGSRQSVMTEQSAVSIH